MSMRRVAQIALVVGAAGCLGLMFHAGRRTPPVLLVLFTGWVLAPFVALAWANVVSARWSPRDRAVLLGLTLVAALGSVGIYADAVVRTPQTTPTRIFLLVPLGSLLLLAIVVAMAALGSRRDSRRGAGI